MNENEFKSENGRNYRILWIILHNKKDKLSLTVKVVIFIEKERIFWFKDILSRTNFLANVDFCFDPPNHRVTKLSYFFYKFWIESIFTQHKKKFIIFSKHFNTKIFKISKSNQKILLCLVMKFCRCFMIWMFWK